MIEQASGILSSDDTRRSPGLRSGTFTPNTAPADLNLLQFGRRNNLLGGIPAAAPRQENVRDLVIVLSGFDSAPTNDPNARQPGERLSAEQIRDYLVRNGISRDNIIVPPTEYRRFGEGTTAETPLDTSQGRLRGYSNWVRQRAGNLGTRTVNLGQNVRQYLRYRDANSSATEQSYRDIRQRMGLQPGERVRLTFVGFSGGGQHALALAGRAAQDRDVVGVQNVITIGSPIVSNPAPRSARVISYVSDRDRILMNTAMLPGVRSTPPNMDDNDAVRRVNAASHTDYVGNPFIMRSVFNDIITGHRQLLRPGGTLYDSAAPIPGAVRPLEAPARTDAA